MYTLGCICLISNLADSALRQWSQTYLYAMEQCKNPRAPRALGGWLRSAGFTDVDERMIPVPMCGWPDSKDSSFCEFGSLALTTTTHADQRENDIGTANEENVRLLLSSIALYPFTHYLRYGPESLTAYRTEMEAWLTLGAACQLPNFMF